MVLTRENRNKQLLRNIWDRYMELPFWLAIVAGCVVAVPIVAVFGLLAFPFVVVEYFWKRER